MSTISSSYEGNTLTAFFDSRHHADDAIRKLNDAGVPQSSIRLVPGYEGDQTVNAADTHKGFFESLADFFLPDEDRNSYAEGLRRGGYLITVSNIPAGVYDRALDILDDEGAVNIDEREQSWRSEGWTGYSDETGSTRTTGSVYDTSSSTAGAFDSTNTATGTWAPTKDTAGTYDDTSAGTYSSAAGTSASSTSTTDTWANTDRDYVAGSDEVIPVVEEQLRVGKRDVNLGRVRVRSYVRETPVNEQVNLSHERVTIERRPVDRALNAADNVFQDRVIEAEERSEEAVVSKEARVTEEIGLRKDTTSREETISDTVRHTEVEVEDDRDTKATTRGSGTFNR